MDFEALDAGDRELVEAARDALRRNYTPGRHTVAAAVLCSSGKIYTGINVEATGYGPCAEPIAVGAALTQGERTLRAIVAVSKDADALPILSPCGNCRQLILDYAPDAWVLIDLGGEERKARAHDLLPGAYRSGFDGADPGSPRRGS